MKKVYDIHKCDEGGGGREGDTNLNTLNSRFYILNNKQFARSGVQPWCRGFMSYGLLRRVLGVHNPHLQGPRTWSLKTQGKRRALFTLPLSITNQKIRALATSCIHLTVRPFKKALHRDGLVNRFVLLLLSSSLLMSVIFCLSVPKSTAEMLSLAYRPFTRN